MRPHRSRIAGRPGRPGTARNLDRVTTVRATIQAVLNKSVRWEDGLDTLTVVDRPEVDRELTTLVREAAAKAWSGGWQPADLHRVVVRRGNRTQGHLVADAAVVHLGQFPPAAVDPRWAAQAEALGANRWWSEEAGYLRAVATRWHLDWVTLLDDALGLLVILADLPPIEMLIPPPGSGVGPGGGSRVDVRLLDRVRGLLAQAESTTYAAEAESFTAKAQELIARHSIDDALLAARAADREVVPFARRIGLDHPYEAEKASLLDAIARANHCRAVWSPELGFATVFGFDGDIDAVDLLHASLLVQAHQAMARTEPPGGKAGRARLRSYRQSFLVAFAVRVGERLAEAAQAVLTGLPDGGELLPVLAARDEQVRETLHRVFPRTVASRSSRVDSREGWDSGRDAADRAALNPG